MILAREYPPSAVSTDSLGIQRASLPYLAVYLNTHDVAQKEPLGLPEKYGNPKESAGESPFFPDKMFLFFGYYIYCINHTQIALAGGLREVSKVAFWSHV